ncbi:MqnA/MqnD/SBP family protein [Vulgatibacter incomptus]|uniref:1,4-dihydroxy-6-naphtoate synthase n=1 Tax=Vulgatibacter incomptus TaxID=1391653 RepID=A0A0K1P8K6_9BACT|nr:MqnA/MqnD/SBP family protein [Vulgatibacter incomptus]AKU89837.1 Menaquinone via futalosine step 4 [Vulgatibacter incomptus]
MRTIHLAYSDDADDAAMFLAIERGHVTVPGVRFEHFRSDIHTLNGLASRGEADVCAVSVAHVPRVMDRYDLLPHGGSVGRGYGPVVVAFTESAPLRRVGVPGLSTTAAAVLRLAAPEAELVEMVGASLADTVSALREGRIDAAVLVHEGRLVYQQVGLKLLLDLGAYWEKEAGLPLPLGANVIRRDLGPELVEALIAALGESIRWSVENRDVVLDALGEHGASRGLDRAGLSHYLDLYANDDTVGYDATCQKAIAELLRRIA